MRETTTQTFTCPHCGEEMHVTSEIRTAVVRSDCPFCTASIDQSAFS